ncbi:MAG TPA: ATP-binding protein, partial [Ohtaekwangia sp.]|nr:ATP-binding protein [Ohtaekwangia sp.]
MELTREISVEQEQFLSGGGEMGRLIRSIDWSLTPVGAVSQWPQSLRTAISIMLNARFPMYIAWGKGFTQFYNDGYRPILGSKKHPQAMGLSTRVTFAEIWNIIGPMFEGVMRGEAVGFEDFMLPLERNGYTEECYFIFSYSPIKQEDGSTGGVLVTVTETTERVLSERRLNTLSELGERASHAQNRNEACRNTLLTIAQNKFDIPFSVLYLYDQHKGSYDCVGSTGLAEDCIDWSAIPYFIQRKELSYLNTLQVEEVFAHSFRVQESAWPETPEVCSFIRLERQDMAFPLGVLILGISPRLRYDGKYVKFFKLVSEHTTTALSNATALEEERKRAEALRELDKAKTTFFSNISHEFRTPITLLLGPVEDLLNRSDVIAQHRESLEAVHRNGMRLLRLVNTLLDFSRIEAGRMAARYYKVDLCAVTFDLASTFRSVIENAGLRFEVECHEVAMPAYVDRPMWEKIILNLLSNAFKYTLEGKIAIRIFRQHNTAVVEVADTGVGIPEHELPRIFERFHRVKNAEARTFEGTGIGLSLVKELVHLHHGEISVNS